MVPATIWYADDNGRIAQLRLNCESHPMIGAALRTENASLGRDGFIVEPRASCKTGAASITLRITFPDSQHSYTMGGEEVDASGQPTGGIAIVNVVRREFQHTFSMTPRPELEWRDGLTSARDLGEGMTIRVQGKRRENCEIDAQVISRR